VRFAFGGYEVPYVTRQLIPGPGAAKQHGAVRPQVDAGLQHQLGQQATRQPGAEGPRLHERLAGHLVVAHQV
jgi:hypothetical protein